MERPVTHDKFDDLVDVVCKHISKKRPVTKTGRKYARQIIIRFFQYAMLAAMHGYPIRKSTRGGLLKFRFELEFAQIKTLASTWMKKIRYSPKAIGYYFILNVDMPYLDKVGCRFIPKKKYITDIIKMTESDKVYDLINPKR